MKAVVRFRLGKQDVQIDEVGMCLVCFMILFIYLLGGKKREKTFF